MRGRVRGWCYSGSCGLRRNCAWNLLRSAGAEEASNNEAKKQRQRQKNWQPKVIARQSGKCGHEIPRTETDRAKKKIKTRDRPNETTESDHDADDHPIEYLADTANVGVILDRGDCRRENIWRLQRSVGRANENDLIAQVVEIQRRLFSGIAFLRGKQNIRDREATHLLCGSGIDHHSSVAAD